MSGEAGARPAARNTPCCRATPRPGRSASSATTGRTGRQRLGHLRRAGNLSRRRRRHRPLEACRPVERRDHRTRALAAGRGTGACAMKLRILACLLLAGIALLAAAPVAAQAVGDRAPLELRDRAEEQRFHHYTSEL